MLLKSEQFSDREKLVITQRNQEWKLENSLQLRTDGRLYS